MTIPEGWKLVPVEPTPEMLKVEVSPVLCIGLPNNPRVGQWRLGVYRSMLAAAPVPPQAEAGPVGYANSKDLVCDGFSHSFIVRTEQLANGYVDGGEQIPLYTQPDSGELSRLRTENENLLEENRLMTNANAACGNELVSLRTELEELRASLGNLRAAHAFKASCKADPEGAQDSGAMRDAYEWCREAGDELYAKLVAATASPATINQQGEGE